MRKDVNYKVSVPVMVHERLDRREVLDVLKACHAQRVFLATGVLSLHPAEREGMMAMLREYVPYFQAAGLEVGIWFWSFWYSGIGEELEDALMVGMGGGQRVTRDCLGFDVGEKSGFCCPASEKFLAAVSSVVAELASTGPDILMLDDDYRFGFHDDSMGCFCDAHMRLYEKRLGRKASREELASGIYGGQPGGQPNEIRGTVLEVLGETLEAFAGKIREAVNRVNPDIRVALCSVMSLWDTDGTDSVKIAKILAGSTKPLLRLTGAPYWAPLKAWGNRLQHVIELERMEYAWCQGQELETMTEGDVFPRPRHRVPASFLEGFDTALRAAGTAEGILKYMLDYTSRVGYETGYVRRHVENSWLYGRIEDIFGGKEEAGVRAYETRNKFRESDLSGISNPRVYVQNQFFSVAARMLSDNAVPTRYSGNEGAGIAFGENARRLPPEAYENGLILDIRGAGILMEQGIDVGIVSIGEKLQPMKLYYPEEDEYVASGYTDAQAYRISVKEGAKVITYGLEGGNRYPDAFQYENRVGQRFLVYAFDAALVCEDRYRSYCMQRQLYDSIRWLSGKPLPAGCPGHPDLYLLCRRSERGMAVGLWNFCADRMDEPVVELAETYERAEFVHCSGELEGNRVRLSALQPYDFAFIHLITWL